MATAAAAAAAAGGAPADDSAMVLDDDGDDVDGERAAHEFAAAHAQNRVLNRQTLGGQVLRSRAGDGPTYFAGVLRDGG